VIRSVSTGASFCLCGVRGVGDHFCLSRECNAVVSETFFSSITQLDINSVAIRQSQSELSEQLSRRRMMMALSILHQWIAGYSWQPLQDGFRLSCPSDMIA
jgi:hypothetical protein